MGQKPKINTKRKLIILTNVLAPYRIPLFNELSEQMDVLVLTCNELEQHRFWNIANIKFNFSCLSGLKLNYSLFGDEPKYIYLKFSVIKYIFRKNTIFLIGDASWTSHLFAFFLTCTGNKYHFWTEHTIGSPRRSGFLGLVRRFTVSRAVKVFCPGTQTEKYLNNIEKRNQGIYKLHNTPAEIFYKQPVIGHRIKKKNKLKFIFVGQLIERKSIYDTVKLTTLAGNAGIDCSVDFVGDGKLKQWIKLQPEASKVNYLGRLKPEQLHSLYRKYDALVLLSKYEPWGLVVNEALLCGTPCLVTNSVGASDIIDSKNGFVVPTIYDDKLLISALKQLNGADFDSEEIRSVASLVTPYEASKRLIKNL